MITYKRIELSFVELELHENYVISTIKEGTTFGQTHLNRLFEVFNDYYYDRPFVSIAHRRYDYTINPNLLKEKPHQFLLAIGVVCDSTSSKQIALFEQKFYPGKFEVFDDMETCLKWKNLILANYIKKAGL
jgi:hypothetical protein